MQKPHFSTLALLLTGVMLIGSVNAAPRTVLAENFLIQDKQEDPRDMAGRFDHIRQKVGERKVRLEQRLKQQGNREKNLRAKQPRAVRPAGLRGNRLAVRDSLRSVRQSVAQERSLARLQNSALRATLSDSLGRLWAVQYGSGLAYSVDTITAMTGDRSGNVYVTGYTYSMHTGYDFFTIKYNSSGSLQWKATYDGPLDWEWGEDWPDRARAIAVDPWGNVYVAGESYQWIEGDIFSVYTIVKYNSNGIQQWVARYNQSEYELDHFAQAITVDGVGNIYVTGNIMTGRFPGPVVTVKYNSSGVRSWVAIEEDGEHARAIAVDASGSVYVAGTGDEDFMLIKYFSSGIRQWVRTYDGEEDGWDELTAMALDRSGNIYVTGVSEGLESGLDFATLKYNSAGQRLWAKRYNGFADGEDWPTAIVVDSLGNNVFVTGRSWSPETGTTWESFDWATIKYSSGGAQRWVRRFDGSAMGDDEPSSVVVDNLGNVTVAGYSETEEGWVDFTVVQYSSAGALRWTATWDGGEGDEDRATGIVLDGAMNLYVSGVSRTYSPFKSTATIKYSSSGAQLWANIHNMRGNCYDQPSKIIVNETGEIFVVGNSMQGSWWDNNYLTMKYRADGSINWQQRYTGGSSAWYLWASSMAVARSGSVYVTGSSDNGGSSVDYTTIKYSADGTQQWAATYNGTGNGWDFAEQIVVDDSGYVYVTGTSNAPNYDYDIVTVKYDSLGVEQWVARFNGRGDAYDVPVAMIIDRTGHLYVTGVSGWFRGSPPSNDFVTLKYSPSGSLLWEAYHDCPDYTYDSPSAMVLDIEGNVYVTGKSRTAGAFGSLDYVTIKYDPDGVEQWVAVYAGSGDDYPCGIVLDRRGAIYVTGTSQASGSAEDYLTIKYHPSGSQLWAVRYNSGPNSRDKATAIVVDQLDNIYVTGESSGGFTTICYDTAGNQKWMDVYRTSATNDVPAAMAVDRRGSVVVTGASSYRTGIRNVDPYTLISTVKYIRSVWPELSSREIAFGTVEVSCRASDTLLVANHGYTPLIVSSASVDDPNFTVVPSDAAIPPLGSVPFVVSFVPLTPGPQTANLVLQYSEIGARDTVRLAGIASGSQSAVRLNLEYDSGWQLFSTPLRATCPPVVSGGFAFSGSGYVRQDTLTTGKGYWRKFLTPTLSFVGFPTLPESIWVNRLWNLIGSCSSPIPATTVITEPESLLVSPFFGYSRAGYGIADTIYPGKAYWAKASQNGLLILGSSGQVKKRLNISALLEGMGKLWFTDAAGRSQVLYFGEEEYQGTRDWNEFPPLPPEGVFDVRFTSNRIVEFLDESNRECPISISSALYPVTIRWELDESVPNALLEIGNSTVALRGSGVHQISRQDGPLKLRFGKSMDVPKSYALSQNFPNPFNPSTSIRYQLPVKSRVKLTIYNVLGQQVKNMVDEIQSAGYHSIEWDGKNYDGQAVASGIYFYRLEAASTMDATTGFNSVMKMVLIR